MGIQGTVWCERSTLYGIWCTMVGSVYHPDRALVYVNYATISPGTWHHIMCSTSFFSVLWAMYSCVTRTPHDILSKYYYLYLVNILSKPFTFEYMVPCTMQLFSSRVQKCASHRANPKPHT